MIFWFSFDEEVSEFREYFYQKMENNMEICRIVCQFFRKVSEISETDLSIHFFQFTPHMWPPARFPYARIGQWRFSISSPHSLSCPMAAAWREGLKWWRAARCLAPSATWLARLGNIFYGKFPNFCFSMANTSIYRSSEGMFSMFIMYFTLKDSDARAVY